MAQLSVNPTRMELGRLKKSLATAVKGHRLLKDKRDELMRQFLELVEKDRQLRASVDEKLSRANTSFNTAASLMRREELDTALLMPKKSAELSVENKNIMSVNVPMFTVHEKSASAGDAYSYGYAFTNADLDRSIELLSEAFEDMIKLAETENAVMLLAAEIERTRRRVNALEYVMIPNYQETIRYITTKLDENERSNTTRLMKVKDMLIKDELEKKHRAE